MKKTLLAVLAALMVLCCFVGCGGTDTLKGTYWIPADADYTTFAAYDEAMYGAGELDAIIFKTDKTVDVCSINMPYKVTKGTNSCNIMNPILKSVVQYTFNNGELKLEGAPALDGTYKRVNAE